MPAVEVHVDEECVRRLLDTLPEGLGHLRSESVEPGGSGWDNAVWRVGERYALRLPVRAAAAEALEREAQWSEVVSAPLRSAGIRVPRPVHHGRTPTLHPWSWLLVEWVPGQVVNRVAVAQRASIATVLARTLPSMHRPAPPHAPVNPGRGRPLTVRHAMTLRAAERARPRLGDATVTALLNLVDEARSAASWLAPPVWCHGDLHDLNLVLDTSSAGDVIGVIDFGDLTSGDPAVDLRVLWITFDATHREGALASLEASGAYDSAVWVRARGWAAAFVLAVASDAQSQVAFAGIIDHTLAQLACP